MDEIHRFSEQVIEYAERLADVADAAKGKAVRRRGAARRWLLLPAAGAGLYALVRSDSFTQQAREVVDEAKTRASELPDDLMKRVRHTSRPPAARTRSRQRRQTQSSSTRSMPGRPRTRSAG